MHDLRKSLTPSSICLLLMQARKYVIYRYMPSSTYLAIKICLLPQDNYSLVSLITGFVYNCRNTCIILCTLTEPISHSRFHLISFVVDPCRFLLVQKPV